MKVNWELVAVTRTWLSMEVGWEDYEGYEHADDSVIPRTSLALVSGHLVTAMSLEQNRPLLAQPMQSEPLGHG